MLLPSSMQPFAMTLKRLLNKYEVLIVANLSDFMRRGHGIDKQSVGTFGVVGEKEVHNCSQNWLC